MRFGLLILLSLWLVGCTSAWQTHTLRLHEAEERRDAETALIEQRWLMDHAFTQGPPEEQGKEREVDRYLRLADLAAQAGDVGEAIAALRTALQTDPARHEAIMQRLAQLPLSAADRKRINAEFHWNIQALLPDAAVADEEMPCWSYQAREIRVRREEVGHGLGKGERRLSYDARAWIFNADSGSWRADGGWASDAGAATEQVAGPPRPRYRAIAAANGKFFTEGPLPPCHRHGWSGPFDPEQNRLFVADHLPGGSAHE